MCIDLELEQYIGRRKLTAGMLMSVHQSATTLKPLSGYLVIVVPVKE